MWKRLTGMSPSAVVQQVYLISFLKWEQIPLLPTRNNMSLQSYFISEGMEFEPRWLLLFHQSAAADRRGDHPLYRAGTTGHRICTTAGNDCVIRPQEHTQPCTDTLRQTPLIQYTSSQRFPWGIWIHWLPEWLILLPIPQKSITISFSCIKSVCRSFWLTVCFHVQRMGTKQKVSPVTSLFSCC